ncbi:hypothetical protein RhiirC2_800214, partial [Rhizophagus irregularis]
LVTLPFSYALRPEFYIQDDILPNFFVPFIEHEFGTSSSKKLWIATTSCRIGKHALDAPPDENSIRSSDLVIGRSLRITPDTSLVLSHWLYTNDDSSSLTPRSSKLTLRPCPGCQHNTISIKRSKSLVKAAHGANCWFYASTYWSIWIPSLPVKKFSSVAAHSDDDLNNRADALAKDHLNSSSIYEPDFTRLQDTLPMIPRFNNIFIDFDLHSLVKTRYEQIQFLNFCILQRFARQSASTSLYSLPTLCLRKRDAPDLYPMDDTCPLCNVNPETLLHVWTCTAPHNIHYQPNSPEISSVFQEYLDCFKYNLRKKLSLYFKKHKTPDSVITLDLKKFDTFSIWDLSLLDSLPLPLSPTAHDLVRGFIPVDLMALLMKYFTEKRAIGIVHSALFRFQNRIYKNLWSP